MLRTSIVFTIAAVTVMVACNQSKSPKNEEQVGKEEQVVFDTSNFQELNLNEYNIDRKLYIKSDNGRNETITQGANGSIEVSLDDDYLIEIISNPLSLDLKRDELESDPLYTVDYIEEANDYIFYSKKIENSGIDPEYHFYLLLEDKNGLIAVKTHDMLQLNKEKAEAILNSFKKQRRIPV